MESEPILLNMQRSVVHCIFCAEECPPSFALVDGHLTRIKKEVEEVVEVEERQLRCFLL